MTEIRIDGSNVIYANKDGTFEFDIYDRIYHTSMKQLVEYYEDLYAKTVKVVRSSAYSLVDEEEPYIRKVGFEIQMDTSTSITYLRVCITDNMMGSSLVSMLDKLFNLLEQLRAVRDGTLS